MSSESQLLACFWKFSVHFGPVNVLPQSSHLCFIKHCFWSKCNTYFGTIFGGSKTCKQCLQLMWCPEQFLAWLFLCFIEKKYSPQWKHLIWHFGTSFRWSIKLKLSFPNKHLGQRLLMDFAFLQLSQCSLYGPSEIWGSQFSPPKCNCLSHNVQRGVQVFLSRWIWISIPSPNMARQLWHWNLKSKSIWNEGRIIRYNKQLWKYYIRQIH